MDSAPSSSGTSGSDTVNFSRFATGVSYDGGAGNDYITGSRGEDTIRGGSGADRIQGGAGSDTYVFVAGDLTGALANGVDHIVDFQGAGSNTASGFQDKLALYGYSADAYLTFHHYAADRVASGTNADGSTKYVLQTNLKMQYYEVIDPADAARNGFILVQMQDGTSQLDVSKTSTDVVFYSDAITGTASGDVTEAGRNEAGSAKAGGTLAATTFDQTTGFKAAPAEALTGDYGDFSFASDGTWSFALDDTRAATQALGAGQTQTQTLTVQTLAGTSQTLTVTVHGTNDAAVITGQAAGAVQEDKTLTAKGTLTVSDIDAGQAQFVARGAQDPVKGAYGSLTIDAAGAWTYTLDNASAAVQALSASDMRTDTLTVASRDGTTQAITVTVQGMNEAAKLIAPIELSAVAQGKGGFKIKGEASGDQAGTSVSGAGDVNGDGVADLIVGARYNDSNGRTDTGAAYVVFGQKDLASTGGINLTDVAAGKGGFKIKGEARNDYAGFSVSGAGDVNGDGVADLIVGANANDSNGRGNNGAAYVVFGEKDLASTGGINLTDVAAGKGGFKVKGEATSDQAGFSVSGAGDVNGDGVADLIVGAYTNSSNGQSQNGAAYVVFGQKDLASTGGINLTDVAAGKGGFKIKGEAINDQAGYAASGAGDVNGDGVADLIVGARYSDSNGVRDTGAAYVVFGQKDLASTGGINLTDVAAGKGGFKVKGEASNDHVGVSVSGAGDVNGDGVADLIVGARYNDSNGRTDTGAAYVVFGQKDLASTGGINLTDVAAGKGGFKVKGEAFNDYAGVSVSGAGDVNGDGVADLLVGAHNNGSNGQTYNGAAYVVFGEKDLASSGINLTDVAAGKGGFKIKGEARDNYAGWSVSGAGDVDGDGVADILVGAPYADSNGQSSTGAAYVVLGQHDWLVG